MRPPLEWLPGIRRTPSPNCDERPDGETVSLLVIHNISLPPEIFSGNAVEALFLNRLDPTAHPYFATIATMRVSAHLLIRRDGSAQQFVPLHKRAWHAGASRFDGRTRCNDFSIGIELEGSDNQAFDPRQYPVLARLTASIQHAYPAITTARIVGHSDIAAGRKTDPGPYFDWQHYRCLLASTRQAGSDC